MGGKALWLASILSIALAAASGAAAAPGCQLAMLAELPVTMDGLKPIISATVNGQPARFIVDSGAFYSLVTPRAAEKFKMRVSDLPQGFYLRGAVGPTSARLGVATSFELDEQHFQRLEFLVAGDSLGSADGLLGQNILGTLDVEYDFANGVVRIFKPTGCDQTMLAYWTKNLAAVSVMPIARTTPLEPHISAHAIVNDLPIKVMFDTGADRSTLKLSTALKAGGKLVADAASADDAMRGIGSRATDSYTIPFSSFEVGNETIKNIRLRVARSDFPGPDMLLGADFFLSHHVLVSQSQHRLYFTYNGGPVFRLDDEGVRSNPLAPVTPVADQKGAMSVGDGKAAGLDADALRRRASAAAARRDFAHAFADLDQAIALEPKNAELYYDRALWRLASRSPAEVGADIETALQLKPDYANALVLRAHMRLAAGELDKAGADFDAAVKAAPDRPDLELEAAQAYAQARKFDRAIARYDAWIAKYPGSFDMVDALNGRCWTRALWGRELDKAVADCNQAMRRGSKLSEVLDSRGMVRLRRGEFVQAIADYDAALKLQPKLAPSLYGRGLAKQKAGDSVGAAADLQAAATIEPDIADRMKSLGITETTVVVASMH